MRNIFAILLALAVVGQSTASWADSWSSRGTWVITPPVLQGHEKIKFIGDSHAAG